jgi:hypothetical protein
MSLLRGWFLVLTLISDFTHDELTMRIEAIEMKYKLLVPWRCNKCSVTYPLTALGAAEILCNTNT